MHLGFREEPPEERLFQVGVRAVNEAFPSTFTPARVVPQGAAPKSGDSSVLPGGFLFGAVNLLRDRGFWRRAAQLGCSFQARFGPLLLDRLSGFGQAEMGASCTVILGLTVLKNNNTLADGIGSGKASDCGNGDDLGKDVGCAALRVNAGWRRLLSETSLRRPPPRRHSIPALPGFPRNPWLGGKSASWNLVSTACYGLTDSPVQNQASKSCLPSRPEYSLLGHEAHGRCHSLRIGPPGEGRP